MQGTRRQCPVLVNSRASPLARPTAPVDTIGGALVAECDSCDGARHRREALMPGSFEISVAAHPRRHLHNPHPLKEPSP